MDTRPVAVVDAFADAPMAGTPVGVVLDAEGLSAAQRRAVADEVGPGEAAFVGGSSVAVASDRDPGRGIHVAVAVASLLGERGRVEGDAVDLSVDGEDVRAGAGDSGRQWIDVPAPEVREVAVAESALADALGVDAAAVRDVGADLPPVRASLGRGFCLVPVNFLEHLSGASPDGDAVADVLAETGAAAIYAYTFDTLGAESDVHGLCVGPEGPRARPTGETAACAAAAIRHYGALDRDELRFEEGALLDRPARLSVEADGDWRVGGRAVTVLDGTVVAPPAGSEDDIVEI